MRASACFLALCLGVGCASTKQAVRVEDPATVSLRSWALSRCLAHAFEGQPSAEDANRSAGGYLEQGKSDIDVYERMDELAKTVAAQPGAGSVPGTYHTLRCIDMSRSHELDALIQADATNNNTPRR